MNRDGLLDKRGNRNNRQYRLMEMVEPEMVPNHNYQRQSSYEKRRA
jgi:hypothetical protein